MENKVKVWIARDKDNRLFAFTERPNKEKDIWTSHGNYFLMKLSFWGFSSVKWEDDEPTEAYITLAEPQEQSKQKQPTQKQEIDWEQRRYEIAKEMMIELHRRGVFEWNELAGGAVELADMLIQKLKEKSE